jgi:hypothetical protein
MSGLAHLVNRASNRVIGLARTANVELRLKARRLARFLPHDNSAPGPPATSRRLQQSNRLVACSWSRAVVIFGSPNTVAHSPKLRLVVMMTLARS